MGDCLVTLPNKPKRLYHQVPSGAINCDNLTFSLPEAFDPDSLVVKLDGNILDPTEYSIAADNMSFTLILSTDANFLKVAPRDTEKITVDYTPLQSTCFACL